MSELQSLSPDLLIHVGRMLQVPMKGLLATVGLLDEGSTVPFIARYRKESTGNLNEVQIRAIEEKILYFRELCSRKDTILASIQEQGKLTGALKASIDRALDKSELEDLYLPYKPKRRTKAMIAREMGLAPLADYLCAQQPTGTPLETFAASFVNAEKGVSNVEDALAGARHIVAETISDNADIRKLLRRAMFEEGVIVSKKAPDAVDEQQKFKMYYDYREPVRQIPSHRMLAIRRGETENVLSFLIELDPQRPLALIKSKIHKQPGDWAPQLNLAAEDAWKRLLSSSITGEVRLELKQRADTDAIQVFRENLRNLLLAPPAGQLSVLGIDPGIRTGCKMIDKFNVRAIAIGNGTASRETDALVRAVLKKEGLSSIFCVMVSESGASVYSASEIARQEFPDLDLTIRGAISIARRLQDPLAELVKLDPKSIGVGQYQHDVDQKHLHKSLETVIESCVNRVGVDLNTASWALLRYVAGVNERTAQKIVEFRNEHGRFRSRLQLTAVPGIGPKTFEQAAGFLRIRHGDHPLDITAVHPESYCIVEQIATSLNVSVDQLIAQPALLEKLDKSSLAAGVYTLNDILEELRKPGRDPRDTFVAPNFSDNVKEIGDLQVGMTLEGIATNVTKFGVFVDVGVHQDGLVHISELSDRYVKEPGDVVKVGQIVKVHVLSADAKTKRISLSMKTPGATPVRGAAPPSKKPAAAPQPTMNDQLAALTDRWKRR
ncbi:MAG: Tex family protein [Bryobacteraceae bacterium]